LDRPDFTKDHVNSLMDLYTVRLLIPLTFSYRLR